MSNRIPFQKPYTCAHDLVSLLQSRGMTIADTIKAENYLEYIGALKMSVFLYPDKRSRSMTSSTNLRTAFC